MILTQDWRGSGRGLLLGANNRRGEGEEDQEDDEEEDKEDEGEGDISEEESLSQEDQVDVLMITPPLASFSGPAQLSVIIVTVSVLQATKRWERDRILVSLAVLSCNKQIFPSTPINMYVDLSAGCLIVCDGRGYRATA